MRFDCTGQVNVLPDDLHACVVFESRSKLYIIMELVTGGELFDRIIVKDHYSEKEAANCFKQIIGGESVRSGTGMLGRHTHESN